MADFTPKKIDLSKINGGRRYEPFDGVTPDAINDPIEAAAHIQQLLESKLPYLYINGGSKPASELTSDLLVEEYQNYVWNITEPFVTSNLFVDGAGISVLAGTNVAVVRRGDGFKFDILGSLLNNGIVAVDRTEENGLDFTLADGTHLYTEPLIRVLRLL